MFETLLESFDYNLEKDGEKCLIDNHKLSQGFYILISEDNEIKSFVRKTKNDDMDSEKFKPLDYLCSIYNTNKCLDSSRKILSNNLYSFYIRVEKLTTLSGSKLALPKLIDGYFDKIKNFGVSHPNLKHYKIVEKEYGLPNLEKIEKHRDYIKHNLLGIIKKFNLHSNLEEELGYIIETGSNDLCNRFELDDLVDKNGKLNTLYIKIYFETSQEELEKESNRYFRGYVFNDYYHNKRIGTPFNLSKNEKKPYNVNRTRKEKSPYLLNETVALKTKKLIDYLKICTEKKENNIYVTPFGLKSCIDSSLLDLDFSGEYFEVIRIKTGIGISITDNAYIFNYTKRLEGFNIDTPILFREGSTYDSKVKSMSTVNKDILHSLISNVLYDGKLLNSYHGGIKTLTIKDSFLSNRLYSDYESYCSWFLKNNTNPIKSSFESTALIILKRSIQKGDMGSAIDQFNLAYSILKYFKGENMLYDIVKIHEEWKKFILEEPLDSIISSDEMFYYGVGQLVYYLQGKSKATNKNQSFINNILNSNNVERLMDLLLTIYKKYNYTLNYGGDKSSRLYSTILEYVPNLSSTTISKSCTYCLLAGYLNSSKNIMYLKKNKKEEELNENE